ncbi:MAG: hypothetical protein ABL958_15780 [Bdellovibrionia bacterium]
MGAFRFLYSKRILTLVLLSFVAGLVTNCAPGYRRLEGVVQSKPDDRGPFATPTPRPNPNPTPTPGPNPTPTPFPQPTPTPTPGPRQDPIPVNFNFSNIDFTSDGGDPRVFTRTSTVTRAEYTTRNEMIIEHSMAGQWPAVTWPFDDETLIDGNQWFLVNVNGRWVAGVNEWTRPGQTTKVVDPYPAPGVFYASDRWGILYGWIPQPGEVVGVFSTTPARARMNQGSGQRTNVWFLRVNADGSMTHVSNE